jgi:hypothetical protein
MQAQEDRGALMTGSYEQLGAAREELALLLGDLSYASGHLEEAATVWRRGGHPGGPELEPGFHKRLRDAADRLVSTLHALVDAGVASRRTSLSLPLRNCPRSRMISPVLSWVSTAAAPTSVLARCSQRSISACSGLACGCGA